MAPFDHVGDRERLEAVALACGYCHLGELAFCAGLDPRETARLAPAVSQIQYRAHATILNEGDPAHHLFSIASGSVKLYKLLSDGRRQVTAFLFAGDFFGLALDEAYAYTAEALTPVMLCRFARGKLETALEQIPKLERRLLGLAISELAAAHDQMLLLGRKTAREKVASFLLMLGRRAERRGLSAIQLSLPMGRADIADYLGLTIETVSRTLTQLKRDGNVTLPDHGHVMLLRPDILRQIAEGG